MFAAQQRRRPTRLRVRNAVYSTGFPTPAASATASMLSSCSWQSASTVIAASSSCSRRCSRGSRGAYLRRGRDRVTKAILRHRCIRGSNCYGGVVFDGKAEVSGDRCERDPARRLRVLRTRFAELEGMGVADRADRLPARGGARALRPVPRRGGGRQRGHLHRSLGASGPDAGLLPDRCRGRRSHRDRGVRRADAGARKGEGRSSRSPGRATAPTTRTPSCGSTSPAGIQCSSATSATGPDRCHRPRSRGTGRSRASPPNCRPASRRTFPRHATRCGSTSPTFAAGYAPPNTPTAQCITCCTRRGTAACGCGRAAGFWRPRRSRRCRSGCGTWATSTSPPSSTPQ